MFEEARGHDKCRCLSGAWTGTPADAMYAFESRSCTRLRNGPHDLE